MTVRLRAGASLGNVQVPMHEYEGALQRLVVSRTLWLVVAWPLAGLAWQVVVARPRIEAARRADDVLRELGRARVAGVGAVALAAVAVLGHALLAWRLRGAAAGLVEPLARGPRFGALDAGFGLWLGDRSLAACAFACAVALAGAVVLARGPAPERGWRAWAWLELALAGALASFLADGFVGAALGWSLVALASAWLAGWGAPGAGLAWGVRGAAAITAMLLAGVLLFWGLGGAWDDEGYAPDPRPRVAAVHAGAGGGGASLSMTALAGARVFVDDARTSELASPFVGVPLSAGPHTLRVRLGDAGDEVSLGRIDVAQGESIVLAALGPTLSFRALADDMALRARDGGPSERSALEQRVAPGGLAVVALALLACLVAACVLGAPSPSPMAPAALSGVAVGATTAAVGPFLLARLDVLFPSAPRSGVVVAAAGFALVLGAVWRALGFVGARRWLVFAAGAPGGLALVALGVGGAGVMLGVLAVTGGAAAAVHFALRRREADAIAAAAAASHAGEESPWLRLPAAAGELLATMERWVVGATVDAVAATARIAAWLAATADEQALARPGNAVAARVARAAAAIEGVAGASLGRVAWGVLGLAAAAVVVHALWPQG